MALTLLIGLPALLLATSASPHWPQFRGAGASGTADGANLPEAWSGADGKGVLWKARIPGLAHSSPVVWGNQVFVTTAISSRADASFKPGLYGEGTASEDRTVHRWQVMSLDKRTGKVLWERTAYEGEPREKRHIKATYANATPATDGRYVVAFFGSQGLYAYDLQGGLKWKRDLGRLDAGAYDAPTYEWGSASSPILYKDLVIVQCDQQKDSFLMALRLRDGETVWKTPREELPSWATPTVYPGDGPGRAELVTNAPNFIRGYDPETGKELWRLGRSSPITAPTPVYDADVIVVMSGRRPNAPIFVVKAGARGDITLPEGATAGGPVLWTRERAGSYMPTPLIYRGYLYVLKNQGILSCYDLRSGEQKYEQRIPDVNSGFSASPVAADGKLYLASEDGDIVVVKAGPQFELAGRNPMGQPLMATPAISENVLLVRGERDLFAIGVLAPPPPVAVFLAALPAGAADYWPTREWRTASPESQGLDSVVLAELLDHVRSRNLPLHSLLLVRRGHLVLDAALYPYEPDRPHDVASVTKSVISVLVGIAIDKGYLRSVDQPVASLLPGTATAALDPRKQQLTIAHLLTMTSGLDCGFEPGEQQLVAMRRSEDWAAFALALPMRAAPGVRYAYCSCNNHLLSAVLSAQTGESAVAFARKHLFEPLGIRDVIWPADPKGRTHGWGDLHLFPRDLARIAYLYLRGGRWNGRQIVSEQWVRRSIAPQVTVRDGVGYGYSWWLNTTRQPPVFEAVGRGGQRAAVLPDEDLVVVFNAGGVDTDEVAPFLFRAIRSAAPLPDNASGSARLRKALATARQPPAPHPPAPLPALARSISGQRYVMDTNLLGLQAMTLVFDERGAARVSLEMGEDEWAVPVGLDGRYRFASTGPSGLPIGAMGRWSSEREFALDVDTVANINHFIIRIEFVGDRVQVTVDEATGEVKGLRFTGRPARAGSLPVGPPCDGPGQGRHLR